MVKKYIKSDGVDAPFQEKLKTLETQIEQLTRIAGKVQCLTQTTVVSADGDSKYIFNSVDYDPRGVIGVSKGTYALNVHASHPIEFIVDDLGMIEVDDSTPTNVTLTVKGDFGVGSYTCKTHGYMGGINRLVYTDTCSI